MNEAHPTGCVPLIWCAARLASFPRSFRAFPIFVGRVSITRECPKSKNEKKRNKPTLNSESKDLACSNSASSAAGATMGDIDSLVAETQKTLGAVITKVGASFTAAFPAFS